MHADTRWTRSRCRWNRHLDWSIQRRADSPKLCRALMTEQGVRPASEHCCRPALQPSEVTTTDDENTAMKAAEAASPEAVGDPALADAQLQELSSSDDAVLVTHEPPDLGGVLVTNARYSGLR
jgi:hypothetical protein